MTYSFCPLGVLKIEEYKLKMPSIGYRKNAKKKN